MAWPICTMSSWLGRRLSAGLASLVLDYTELLVALVGSEDSKDDTDLLEHVT